MFLVWLKNALNLDFTSWLFNLNESTVSRMLISWINYLYSYLGAIPIGPTKDQIRQSVSGNSFKDTYLNTRCTLDCIKLFFQSPTSLKAQSSLYSFYEHRVTYKLLVDISSFGAIVFISQLYDGSISDKEIAARSAISDPQSCKESDSCMADRGFTIADDLKALNIELNIPAFLSGRDQLTKADVKESQSHLYVYM